MPGWISGIVSWIWNVDHMLGVAGIAAILLGCHLLFRRRAYLRDMAGDWLGRERPAAPAYATRPGESLVEQTAMLPSATARTEMLSSLAGDDGERFDYFRSPRRAHDLPRRAEERRLPSAIAAKAEEVMREARGWHWTLDRWEPPADLWQLPAGDWLRELVTA